MWLCYSNKIVKNDKEDPFQSFWPTAGFGRIAERFLLKIN